MSGPTAIVDYSRPVGWWCPVCGDTVAVSVGPYGVPPRRFCANVLSGSVFCFRGVIPRYLPIPDGQRPPAASEVEEAEVVTFTIPGTADPAWCAPPGWTTFKDTAEEIYEIVVGVKAFVTGATE